MKKIAYLVGIVIVFAIIYYSMGGGGNDQAYMEKVADVRAERVRFLKSSEQSPFQQFDKK